MASGFNNNSYGNVLTQSASGTGQWIHAGVNHPMFNGDSAAFTISKSRKVAAEDKLEIARDTLVRLSSVRPMHKTHRNKFDKTNTIHIADKSNKIQTAEDDIHINMVEQNFRASLRPLDFMKLKNAENSIDGSGSTAGSPRDSSNKNAFAVPPRFYQEDMDKWMTKKF